LTRYVVTPTKSSSQVSGEDLGGIFWAYPNYFCGILAKVLTQVFGRVLERVA
jgi:hypothetical protein